MFIWDSDELAYLASSSEKNTVVDNERPHGKVTIEMEMTMALKMNLKFQWKRLYQIGQIKKLNHKNRGL